MLYTKYIYKILILYGDEFIENIFTKFKKYYNIKFIIIYN